MICTTCSVDKARDAFGTYTTTAGNVRPMRRCKLCLHNYQKARDQEPAIKAQNVLRRKNNYDANIDQMRAKARVLGRLRSPEKNAVSGALYRSRHPDKINERVKRYAALHLVEHSQRSTRWNKKESNLLTDGFVARRLVRGTALTTADVSQTMIDAARELVRLQRYLKELKK